MSMVQAYQKAFSAYKAHFLRFFVCLLLGYAANGAVYAFWITKLYASAQSEKAAFAAALLEIFLTNTFAFLANIPICICLLRHLSPQGLPAQGTFRAWLPRTFCAFAVNFVATLPLQSVSALRRLPESALRPAVTAVFLASIVGSLLLIPASAYAPAQALKTGCGPVRAFTRSMTLFYRRFFKALGMYLQIAVVFALISRVLDFVAFRWFPAAVIAQVENRYLFTFLSGSVPFLISDILMPVRQALVIQMFDVLDETEKTAKNKVY